MRKKGYRGVRCEKRSIPKCEGICRTYDELQSNYADTLAEDETVAEIRCNVLMKGLEIGEYTTDFVCIRTDGSMFVRECVFRKLLKRHKTIELLTESQKYWYGQGIYDWKIVVDAVEEGDT